MPDHPEWRPETPDQYGWRPVGRLEHDGQLYRFWYTHGARKPGFRPFPQMEDLEQVYESAELFPLFFNRLLSKSRPEYEAYLRWSGFSAGSRPDPIVVLGRTEGIRQTDAIEVFPCPIPAANGCYFNKFFLHGIRWLPAAAVKRIDALAEGEELTLVPEPQNKYDPNAIAVLTEPERIQIGYVPRYFAHEVSRLSEGCGSDFVKIWVDRVNRDAPLQNRVLCGMAACWPDDFQPCHGEDFEPIPRGVPARCNS